MFTGFYSSVMGGSLEPICLFTSFYSYVFDLFNGWIIINLSAVEVAVKIENKTGLAEYKNLDQYRNQSGKTGSLMACPAGFLT